MKFIINKPNISNLEKKYVLEALNSTWLSSGGTNTQIFEKNCNESYTGCMFQIRGACFRSATPPSADFLSNPLHLIK